MAHKNLWSSIDEMKLRQALTMPSSQSTLISYSLKTYSTENGVPSSFANLIAYLAKDLCLLWLSYCS